MGRDLTPELMDDPQASREELRRSLRYLRWVNRRLGGRSALLGRLRKWSKGWPRDRPVTLLDLGTGSADLPVEARRWAEGAGFDLRITGVDAHATTLDLAREHVGDVEGVELVEADARRLLDRFEPGSFDYAHAGLFLHHLPDIEVMTVLRIMDRLSRRGVIWNDLARTALARLGVRVVTIGAPPMARHDAVVSVRAGFTRREALDLARRAGLNYLRWRLSPLSQRFTLAGEKRGAWSLPE